MSGDLILQGAAIPTFLVTTVAEALGAMAVLPAPQQVRFKNIGNRKAFTALMPWVLAEKLNWAFLPSEKKWQDYRLWCFDMDSTLITIECIDELADFAGKKKEVAAVTEAAMQGEIDYKESLQQRLALLAGLDARMLSAVYEERLQFSEGVEEVLNAAHTAGIRTAILSGGFTYFTERLRIEMGFDFSTSNELEIVGGKMSGRVKGEIIDAAAKARHLERLRKELHLQKEEVIACGDGANDVPMMKAAGLSIAFHAKEAAREAADIAINHGSMAQLLRFLA